MGSTRTGDRGELVLLGAFVVFTAAFLLDIRDLPMEGKMLSYLAAPVVLALVGACAVAVLRNTRKRDDREALEVRLREARAAEEHGARERTARNRLLAAVGLSWVLFGGIFVFGFYLGSGLFFLAWFVGFRRLTRGTAALTVLGPAVLYVVFEVLLRVGLPEGFFFEWLGY